MISHNLFLRGSLIIRLVVVSIGSIVAVIHNDMIKIEIQTTGGITSSDLMK